MYQLHNLEAPHKLNFRLFFCGLIIYFVLAILDSVVTASSGTEASAPSSRVFPLFLHALIEFATLNIIYCE